MSLPRQQEIEIGIILICLFELMLNVPVNSKSHAGTLPPFYGTITKNEDVITAYSA